MLGWFRRSFGRSAEPGTPGEASALPRTEDGYYILSGQPLSGIRALQGRLNQLVGNDPPEMAALRGEDLGRFQRGVALMNRVLGEPGFPIDSAPINLAELALVQDACKALTEIIQGKSGLENDPALQLLSDPDIFMRAAAEPALVVDEINRRRAFEQGRMESGRVALSGEPLQDMRAVRDYLKAQIQENPSLLATAAMDSEALEAYTVYLHRALGYLDSVLGESDDLTCDPQTVREIDRVWEDIRKLCDKAGLHDAELVALDDERLIQKAAMTPEQRRIFEAWLLSKAEPEGVIRRTAEGERPETGQQAANEGEERTADAVPRAGDRDDHPATTTPAMPPVAPPAAANDDDNRPGQRLCSGVYLSKSGNTLLFYGKITERKREFAVKYMHNNGWENVAFFDGKGTRPNPALQKDLVATAAQKKVLASTATQTITDPATGERRVIPVAGIAQSRQGKIIADERRQGTAAVRVTDGQHPSAENDSAAQTRQLPPPAA